MNLSDIDQNFKIPEVVHREDLEWIDVRDSRFSIHGLYHPRKEGPFCRMHPLAAAKVSQGVSLLNRHTAGGRIRFATDSPYIAIRVLMHVEPPKPHMTLCCQAGFDLYRRDEQGQYRHERTFVPPVRMTDGYEYITDVSGKNTEYMFHLPLYNGIEKLYIGIQKGASLRQGQPYRHLRPIIFYGSSITQGGCASRPGNAYEALFSRELDTDFINLGFSGNAYGEPAMAEYLGSLDMSVFVCDYDHNAPNPEHLQNTHRNFYEIFRNRQPETPILFLSRPDFDNSPDCPRRREIILQTLEWAKQQGDQRVYFVDGAKMFGKKDRDACTVDRCHPTDLGFWRMAQEIGPILSSLLK